MEVTEAVALKPCPRCGQIPEIRNEDVEPQGDPWYGRKVERFVLCKCGLCLFDEYFHDGFVTDADAIAAPLNERLVADARAELRGKNLACCCPLDQPCHADVLLELANSGEAE